MKTDGTIACWGQNGDGESTPPSGTFARVSVGGTHSCGLALDGTVTCWGSNALGESKPPVGLVLRTP